MMNCKDICIFDERYSLTFRDYKPAWVEDDESFKSKLVWTTWDRDGNEVPCMVCLAHHEEMLRFYVLWLWNPEADNVAM